MAPDRTRAPTIPGHTFLRHIATGGFAEVLLYREDSLDREVAVKVPRASTGSEHEVEQFRLEANLMATLSHPFIAEVYHTGLAGRRPYITMKYYPKPNFGQQLEAGPLRVERVLQVGVQVAAAVEHAHRKRVLHKDIKPGNILLDEFDAPRLTDFGISAVANQATRAESGLSIPYAPPELLREESLGDVASDIYSLGATLYALTTGRSPFAVPGEDLAQLLARVLNEAPQPIRRPDVPDELRTLLVQMLRPRPADRPQSAVAVARTLNAIESKFGLQPTDIRLADTSTIVAHEHQAGDRTELAMQVVHQAPDPGQTSSPDAPPHGPLPPDATISRQGQGIPSPVAPPMGVDPVGDAGPPEAPSGALRTTRARVAAATALVVIVGLVVAALLRPGDDSPTAQVDPADRPAVTLRPVVQLAAPTITAKPAGDGRVALRWNAEDVEAGDQFAVFVTNEDVTHRELYRGPATSKVVSVTATGRSCFTVLRKRVGSASREGKEACVTVT
jgi:serine/threonine protein kinase